MKTYYIYHVPGEKIGVTVNPKERIKYAQGYNDYEILEEHTCIDTVSQREIELQIEYFGIRDSSQTYKQSCEKLEGKRILWTSETARAASALADRSNCGWTKEMQLELSQRPKLKARVLTPEQVKEIRDVYVPYKYPFKKDLALQYRVSQSSINKVNNFYPPYDYQTP